MAPETPPSLPTGLSGSVAFLLLSLFFPDVPRLESLGGGGGVVGGVVLFTSSK